MMILSLICSVMFFLSAILLFMPKFRKYPFFKPFGVYMAYQGIWTLLSYIVNQLFPTNQVMTVFNYLGSFVFCVYFLFIMYSSRKGTGKGKAKASKATPSEKTSEKKRQSQSNRFKAQEKLKQREPKKENKKKQMSKTTVSNGVRQKDDAQKEYTKKNHRFAENSAGNNKYVPSEKSKKQQDIYDDIYDDFDDLDTTADEKELDNIDDVEITDEDLEYYGEENTESEEDSSDDVDIYEELDDMDLEPEEEDLDDLKDEDYSDDLFEDYDDEDDDDDDSFPLRGSRYRK